jgi:hypothetical protein
LPIITATPFTLTAQIDVVEEAPIALLGLGCGIWVAQKIEENPIVPRRRLLGLESKDDP